MITVERADNTILATGPLGKAVTVETVGWDEPAPDSELIADADTALTGRVSSLTLPSGFACIKDIDDVDENFHVGQRLSDGRYQVEVVRSIHVYVGFDGPADVFRNSDDALVLSFQYPTPVTIGFWSLDRSPTETLTVPETPEGVATALTHLSSSMEVSTPQRSYPILRDHPPLIEFGDETNVPDAIRERTEDTGVELVMPRDLSSLLPAATLGYYLGAEFRIEDRDAPLLRASNADVSFEFSPLPAFQYEVNALLRRVYLLECLVRPVGERSDPVAEFDLLDRVDLDPDRCFDAPPDERLATYLDVDFERIGDDLPGWHYRTYARPDYEHVAVLPFLLDDLCAIYLQTPAPHLETSGTAHRITEVVDEPTAICGWLTEESPPLGVAAHPSAYQNRLRDLNIGETVDVVLVCNDERYQALADDVERTYRRFGAHVSSTCERVDGATCDELARIVESEADVVHVVGQAADGTLTCTDGSLDLDGVRSAKPLLFVLDAPGSRRSGLSLVRNGSIAGLVHTGTTLDECHGRFVRAVVPMVLSGVALATAVAWARYYTDGGEDGLAVGDGTFSFSAEGSSVGLPVEVEPEGNRRFRFEYEATMPDAGYKFEAVTPRHRTRLMGGTAVFDVEASELAQALDVTPVVVIYEGELYHPDELLPFYPVA